MQPSDKDLDISKNGKTNEQNWFSPFIVLNYDYSADLNWPNKMHCTRNLKRNFLKLG